jgi:hypothetical protein
MPHPKARVDSSASRWISPAASFSGFLSPLVSPSSVSIGYRISSRIPSRGTRDRQASAHPCFGKGSPRPEPQLTKIGLTDPPVVIPFHGQSASLAGLDPTLFMIRGDLRVMGHCKKGEGSDAEPLLPSLGGLRAELRCIAGDRQHGMRSRSRECVRRRRALRLVNDPAITLHGRRADH